MASRVFSVVRSASRIPQTLSVARNYAGGNSRSSVPEIFRPFEFRPFDDFFKPFTQSLNLPRVLSPSNLGMGNQFGAVEVAETENSHIFTADTPGMKAEDVKVSIKDNILTFSGTRKSESKKEDKDKNIYYSEKSYGSFSRSFQLPENVDKTRVEAVCKDGVLKVTIPKTAPSTPNEVEINVVGAETPEEVKIQEEERVREQNKQLEKTMSKF